MNGYKHEDRLELLGLLGGGFVVIVALGTLIGAPWSTAQTATIGLIKTFGVLLTLLLGLGTMAFSYSGDITDAVSNEASDSSTAE